MSKNRRSRVIQIALAASLLSAVLAGCASNSLDKSSNETAAGAPAAKGAKSEFTFDANSNSTSQTMAVEKGTDGTGASASTSGALATADNAMNQKLIYKANYSMQVKNFTDTEQEIRKQVAAAGGYILNFNQSDNGTRKSGHLTAKVPAKGLSSLLDALDKLPVIDMEHSVNGTDVTEEYVDLDSRLKAKEVMEERLLTFLSSATKADDLVAFSNSLGNVQEEIEQIKGRMRYLNENVAMSTIDIDISEKGEPLISVKKEGLWGSMTSAFTSSLHALKITIQAILIFLMSILPFLIVIGVLVFLVLFVQKRLPARFKKKPDPARPPVTLTESAIDVTPHEEKARSSEDD
ncbi:DUF4349 domain-containing protein [Gorillibacterium massiliense]|uniref:DUF4349 domain-containing protein n=1 Tax=Gorillibacterium massiliense TaxID=1280390 RepID=UPI0004BC83A6|nr:DUF4349 domain-containing protein [Gorillibacterium massiliense]